MNTHSQKLKAWLARIVLAGAIASVCGCTAPTDDKGEPNGAYSEFRLEREHDVKGMYVRRLGGGHDWTAIVAPHRESTGEGGIASFEGTVSEIVLTHGTFYSKGTHAGSSASPSLLPPWPCIRTTRIKVTAEGTEYAIEIKKKNTIPLEDVETVAVGELNPSATVTIEIISTGDKRVITVKDQFVQVAWSSKIGDWAFVKEGANDADALALLKYAQDLAVESGI